MMLYPCILGIALSVCLLCFACLTVFVNYLVKQFTLCLGVVVILLFNVMEVFSVCVGHVRSSKSNVCIVPVIPHCTYTCLFHMFC